MGLPVDSPVHLYAKMRYTERHYDLGTVGKRKYPEYTNLDELSKNRSISFRLLVVDSNSSYILASAENFSPKNEEEEPIFPARTEDIGNLIWRVDFTNEEEQGPVLLLNLKFDHILDLLRDDDEYIGLIVPQAVRLALNHLINNDTDSDPESWQSKWRQYLEKDLKIDMETIPVEKASDSVVDTWLTQVIEKFSEKNKLFDNAINSRAKKQGINNG